MIFYYCLKYWQLLSQNEDARRVCHRLSSTIENLVQTRLFLHFLSTGQLGSMHSVSPCNDEEYVGMWQSQELQFMIDSDVQGLFLV